MTGERPEVATPPLRGPSARPPTLPGNFLARRQARHRAMQSWETAADYWSEPLDAVCADLEASLQGLTSVEAARRHAALPQSRLDGERSHAALRILWNQVKSPLVLILFGAAVVAGITQDWTDTALVLLILAGSTAIGFWREYGADAALAQLRERISIKSRVVRDGVETEVPVAAVVPGDVVLLGAGSLVPGDAVVVDAIGLFVDQAIITGESFPVEKAASTAGIPRDTPLSDRGNCLYFGTSVRSGSGRALVVKTGLDTAFGDIARHLSLAAPETEFDRGLRQLGGLLLTIIFIMVILVFGASTLLQRATAESLMFAVALAVGLSPELLPAIVTVSLARSARTLAREGVLVRHLNAIENLGSMDVLCTDKTGTITEGRVELEGALGVDGAPSDAVLALAAVNARAQGGIPNPLDDAILRRTPGATPPPEKLGEIPYDFVRKRLSVVVRDGEQALLVCKGALDQVLSICGALPGKAGIDDDDRARISDQYRRWSDRGVRVLGLATRDLPRREGYDVRDETGLTLRGFLIFTDQPKAGVSQVLRELGELGVPVKIITGDNQLVARRIAEKVGMRASTVMTGEQLDDTSDEALWRLIDDVSVFAQVDPNQKERIILALKKRHHVVGYLGDGVNDAPAMHAADAAISVDSAADVAKSAADFVLLDKDLAIIARGVRAGRHTFANTLKYVLLTTSANLGNMISMAVTSLFLPFLPLLAGQILLNNFLSDLPAIGLADDDVDPELLAAPRRWDIGFIRKFMVEFGLISSLFDLVTFGLLLWVFKADVDTFRTAWFIESVLTEVAVVYVLRTRRSFYRSVPGRLLLVASAVVALAAISIPYVPLARDIGFVPLPEGLMAAILLLTALYVLATEVAKHGFYRRLRPTGRRARRRHAVALLRHSRTRGLRLP